MRAYRDVEGKALYFMNAGHSARIMSQAERGALDPRHDGRSYAILNDGNEKALTHRHADATGKLDADGHF